MKNIFFIFIRYLQLVQENFYGYFFEMVNRNTKILYVGAHHVNTKGLNITAISSWDSTVLRVFISKWSTAPFCSERNGIVERMNTTFGTHSFNVILRRYVARVWAEAFNTDVYVRNRKPKTPLNEIMPFEKFFGQKTKHFESKSSGCIACMHIPDAKRNKLDEKSSTRVRW